VDRLVEVYNTSSARRYDNIAACFQPDVSLCVLKTGAAVIKGVERLRDSMPSKCVHACARVPSFFFYHCPALPCPSLLCRHDSADPKSIDPYILNQPPQQTITIHHPNIHANSFSKREATCTRRLLILSDDPTDPSFSLDFYPAGHAPGMQAFGKGNTPLDTAILFQGAPGAKNRIAQVWIAPDTKGLATAERVSELDVLSSKLFGQVAAVVKERVKGTSRTSHHFHDYRNMETIG
jgi:hypothetical protein